MESDNQQGRTVGLDFLAGLIVGEGCFYLGVVRSKGDKLRITPGFRLVMNDHETMDIAIRSLQALGLPLYINERKDGGKVCGVNGLKRTLKYCQTLIPYMTGTKQRAAVIVLTYCLSRLSDTKGSQHSETQIDLVRKLRETNGQRNGKKTPL